MSRTAEITVTTINKDINSAPEAFAYGFAESMGKAIAWALTIGFVIWAFNFFDVLPASDPTETKQQ